MKIPLEWIQPNPEQPRVDFDEAALQSLAESIAERGLIHPVVVTEDKSSDRLYFLIDGERRWRAHKLLGLAEIEAVVRENGSDRERFLAALIANVQRQNLNVVEEALAFQRMADELGMSMEEIAWQAGYSQATVNARRYLLRFDPDIQQLFAIKALPFAYEVLQALMMLPEEIRTQQARSFAQRRTGLKGITTACRRISGMNLSGRPVTPRESKTVEKPLLKASERNPALKIAGKRSKADPGKDHWNAIAQAGIVPPWEQVRAAAEAECEVCSLYAYASETNCRECPLPGFLVRLMERAEGKK